MFKIKLRDFGSFVALTALHVCSVLQPVVEAQANVKTIYPVVDRNLLLQVGYQYNHWMLGKSMMYSLLVLIGLWYSRHLQQARKLETEERRGILKDSQQLTAEEVKAEWLSRQRQDAFPMSKFLCFATPWLLTFVGSGLINYVRLYLVIQHFCVSNWRAIQLYGELHVLFLRRLLAVALIPYWSQFAGGDSLEEAAASLPANYISYETHLLD
ncbi:uncharacterized protein Dana_GF10594 [Drosophila ananassae]|uniref:Uncharacterized protein n=1 Tax=Drosophila ananassae TaxID=7217 RepID=B3M5B3_DROAN|nr:uncharacterized protein LOC6493463 [Drosophila ananassae]EDV40618.1 uncharacterized protein Dana_GF10594 [Drosophila ananassae]KAH8345814.1 hypothetical protein KR067_006754 [Drosophila pandora]